MGLFNLFVFLMKLNLVCGHSEQCFCMVLFIQLYMVDTSERFYFLEQTINETLTNVRVLKGSVFDNEIVSCGTLN